MRNQRRLRTAAVVAAVALALGACGRDDNGASSDGGGGGGDPTAQTGPGWDGTTITLGMLTVETGTASAIGLPLSAGQDTYWKRVNDEGGVAGKYKVELKQVDTKYEAAEATNLYRQLKGEVAMFSQLMGTNVVDALKEDLAADEILGQPATLDAFWVHEPALMPFGAPYQIQTINAFDYAVRELDAKNKKLCALTKDDPYGEAGLDGYEHALEALDLTGAATATFAPGDADFTAQINTLQGAGCEIVSLTALPTETAPIFQAAAARQYAPKWIGNSPSWHVALASSPVAPYFEQNFLLAAEGVNWGDTSVPSMKKMMDDIARYAPDTQANGYFAFGYNEGWAVHQVLEKAVELGDLTQKGILDASHQIEKLSFEGGYGDYGYGAPEEREPSRQTTIYKIDTSKPNGTEAIETNFVSEAARSYEFDAA